MRSLIALSLLVAACGTVFGQESKAAEVVVPFFGNAKCPVTGRPVDREHYALHQGQRIYTCCENCLAKVEAKTEDWIDQAYPPKKVKKLENAKCPIMTSRDAKARHTVVFQGHEVRLCCLRCKGKFQRAPRLALARLLHPEWEIVGNEKCLIEPQDDVNPDVFAVHGKRLVHFCCLGCLDGFVKNPKPGLEELASREKKAKKEKPGKEGGGGKR